jgi:hypothetical protein
MLVTTHKTMIKNDHWSLYIIYLITEFITRKLPYKNWKCFVSNTYSKISVQQTLLHHGFVHRSLLYAMKINVKNYLLKTLTIHSLPNTLQWLTKILLLSHILPFMILPLDSIMKWKHKCRSDNEVNKSHVVMTRCEKKNILGKVHGSIRTAGPHLTVWYFILQSNFHWYFTLTLPFW